tara:strand:+ start:1965 stop:2114 length:150 start_codon:yes stop_codon:yes gene_type:complete
MSMVDISMPFWSLMKKVITIVYDIKSVMMMKVDMLYPMLPNLISSASVA